MIGRRKEDQFDWSPKSVARLKVLLATHSYSQAALKLRTTRNSVAGKAKRLRDAGALS